MLDIKKQLVYINYLLYIWRFKLFWVFYQCFYRYIVLFNRNYEPTICYIVPI